MNGRGRYEEFLTKTAMALDIPDHVYEDAMLKYEDVGAWLAADDSELQCHSPEIYPQGSFRLGTVVRPISDENEYDIDLVCHLNIDKEQITQKDLKRVVGERLKKRADLLKITKPSRRCWILGYPAEANMPRFHMDVLPAIPNRERLPSGILITDTELVHWQKSNPRDYADWFYEQMKDVFQENRAVLAESAGASIEEVPEWQVKTPLQRAIQILKRHRDIHFQTDPDSKPVSIIITTLAARAYCNEENIFDALNNIVQVMPRLIENRNGRWWVTNPVDPDENFADKWNEYSERREAFGRWLQKAQSDFFQASQKKTSSDVADLLTHVLGERIINKAASDLGLNRASPTPLVITPQARVQTLGNTQHCQQPPWSMQEQYKVNIRGSVHLKERGRKVWELAKRPVPKKFWLQFIAKTNAPAPYDIQWQVVNTGAEAAEAKQLRGNFESSGGRVRWESTAFNGTHWVEAFIIKNGVCVGRSGRKHVRVR